jgi:putative inorganic carbon (HCO3(-)) transporter
VQLQGRVAAALRRPPSVDPLHLAGLILIPLVCLVLAAGAVERPTLLLLSVAAAVGVFVVLARTEIAILLVVASAPLEGAFSSGPAGISVTKLAGGLAIASFAFTLVRQRRRLVFERGQAIVLAILAFALVSTLQAREPSAAMTTTTRYASFALVYVIFTQLGHDRILQRRIAWTLAITCSIAAGLGLNEYFSGREQLATLPNTNSNDFAFILATSLPLMFWLLGRHRTLRPLLLGMIGLVFAATLLSLSRGALVGLGAGLAFLLLTDRRRIQLTLTAGALATIGVLLVVHSNPQRFQQALLLKQQVAQQNVATRFEAWGAAARLATDHPLLGVGPGNFQFYFNKLTGNPVGTLTLTVAHNALLDVGAELGLVAMCLLALYLLLVFARLTDSLQRGYGDAGFLQALRISLVIATVSAMFLSEQYFLPLWLIGGLAGAIWADGRRAEDEAEAAAPAR